MSKEVRINVIPHLWRVVYRIDGSFEPQKIKYTIEAESRDKAYLIASDEGVEIASLLGVSIRKVIIESVSKIVPKSGD